MNRFSLAFVGALALASPAVAQTPVPGGQLQNSLGDPASTGAITGGQNNTGGDVDVVIPRGSTGADTFQSNSAAAGNANQPERAVPQGSGGGGAGGEGGG